MTSKFKVGDIICTSTYPGRDHWQQVAEVRGVHKSHYSLRPIQSRTTDRDWSTESEISGARILSRGGWEEAQTQLFHGPTLEAKKRAEEAVLEAKIRRIVREEMAAAQTPVAPVDPNDPKKGRWPEWPNGSGLD